ncbi:MAG: hypothetical protein IKV66_15920 [Clostridia bacterium]|nr:hypothetical protein [Clostridia bacterium]
MKFKKSLLLTVLAVFLTLSVLVFSVFAEESAFEGSDLPVSESYVLRAIGALEERVYQKIDTMIDALNARIDAIGQTVTTTTPPPAPAETEAVQVETEAVTAETEAPANSAMPITDYDVVYLTKGQTIVGSSEFILRSGSAISTCPGINGITDITDGVDLTDGMEIPWNHLLLVPRDDGRGITVTSVEAYIMARGQYTVIDAPAE